MLSFSPALGRDGNGPYRLLRGIGDGLVRRFLAALDDPRAAQERRLRLILQNLAGSRFAQEHPGLTRAQTLNDLRSALPIRGHADHLPWLDAIAAGERRVLTRAPVTSLLETSGTSGTPKWLPVTAPWARSVSEAQQLWILAMIRDHEAVTRGKALTIVSPAVHAHAPGGLPVGSNTGRMHLAQPWWLRLRYPVPYRAFTLSPADLRLYTLLRFALQQPISSLTTANPSTLLLLCRRLQSAWREDLSADLRDGTLRHGPARDLDAASRRWLERRLRRHAPPTDWRPAQIWPLALLNWKGGPAQYFVDRLPEAIGADLPVREVGVTASEGYFAIPLGDDWPGGVLWTEGHLLEFVPEDSPTPDADVRWSWELEVGGRYRLIITTEAGLYRYDLQDIVEVVGFCQNTPVIRFVGKAGRYLNTIGEKVSEAQVSAALRDAARQTGLHPIGFTAQMRLGEVPHIELAIEAPSAPPAALSALSMAFDEKLQAMNVEYSGKRASGRLGEVAPRAVSAGTYARYRARRVAEGAPEGQIKDPITALHDAEWQRILDASAAPLGGEENGE